VFDDVSALATTITCTDDGDYTLTLRVNDGINDPVEDSVTLTVSNVSPDLTITAPTEGTLHQVLTPVDLAGVFTDPGTNDTHACTIDWQDATVDDGSLGNGTCTGSHVYTEAGVYTIAVTIEDDDGSSDTETVMIVVYDPDGGFVTGGGWIESPERAHTPDPSLTGKATFGFVSKYKKGADTPTGNTEFQFKAAGLNFHSSSYDWLIVTGSDYAKFKGFGTINGDVAPNGEEYRFMLWAGDGTGDGGADTFRIRIWWEEGELEHVVYDNAAAQEIGGGSIVVHTKK
jgi:hypothetical protein